MHSFFKFLKYDRKSVQRAGGGSPNDVVLLSTNGRQIARIHTSDLTFEVYDKSQKQRLTRILSTIPRGPLPLAEGRTESDRHVRILHKMEPGDADYPAAVAHWLDTHPELNEFVATVQRGT